MVLLSSDMIERIRSVAELYSERETARLIRADEAAHRRRDARAAMLHDAGVVGDGIATARMTRSERRDLLRVE
jgi:hypothetical protein